MTTRVLVPTGVLGLGFDRKALARGVALRPDIIAVDGGSTDSGPFSLGAGESKYARAATKSGWGHLVQARADAGMLTDPDSHGVVVQPACDAGDAASQDLAQQIGAVAARSCPNSQTQKGSVASGRGRSEISSPGKAS